MGEPGDVLIYPWLTDLIPRLSMIHFCLSWRDMHGPKRISIRVG